MYRVTEINLPQELATLREAWERLLAATPRGTFFQSLEWLETYWEFHGGESQLRILLVELDGEAIGIVPLAVSVESYRIGRLRVLGYPLAGWGSFYGPIGPRPAETLKAALEHIRTTTRDWDLLDLRWVDALGVDHGDTPEAMRAAGFRFDSQVWHLSAQIDLTAGWDAYWKSRKSEWRSNVRRCERLLSRHGTIEHLRYRPSRGGEPRWDLYDTCVELACRSWQGSSTSGTTLSHDSVREYLRAAHESAAEAGAVDLNLLLLNGQPVAFAYNYHWRGWVYGLRSGFDPAAAHDGAGNVLMAKMIEDSCRRGDRLIDLGPNYLECKRYWLTRLQPAYQYTHFSPRPRAQAIRLKRKVGRWLGRAGNSELPRLQNRTSPVK